MGSIIGSIISAVISAGLQYFSNWQKAKQAEADKWNLAATQAQMQSVIDGHALEVKMDQAAAAIPQITTLSDMRIQFCKAAAIILLLLSLTGCWTAQITTNQYKPEIRTPEPKPAMFQGPEQLNPREQALAQYAAELKVRIETYNATAEQSNIDAGYVPGVKSKDKAREIKKQKEKELKRPKEATPKS